MMQHAAKFGLFLLSSSFVLTGCSGGSDGPETASLTGEVKKMDGTPVSNVTVVFYPESGPSALAKTDDAGSFTATVPLGTARVAVLAESSASSEDTSPEALKELAKAESRIKPRFASPETSGLTVDVEPTQEDKLVFVVE